MHFHCVTNMATLKVKKPYPGVRLSNIVIQYFFSAFSSIFLGRSLFPYGVSLYASEKIVLLKH